MCRRELPQGGAGGALRSGYILHAAGHSPLHILSPAAPGPATGLGVVRMCWRCVGTLAIVVGGWVAPDPVESRWLSRM